MASLRARTFRPVRRPLTSSPPEIESTGDLLPYYEHYLTTLSIFDVSRVSAVLDCLRVLQLRHTLGDILSAGKAAHDSLHYASMREIQDLLRVLLYELVSRCPVLDGRRLSSIADLNFAAETCSHFLRLTTVRDRLDAWRAGFLDVAITDNCVTLSEIRDPTADLVRSRRQLDTRRDSANEVGRLLDRQELSEAFAAITATTTLAPQNHSFTIAPPSSAVSAFIAAVSTQSPSFLFPESLPGDWSLGPYSLDNFRSYWNCIQALVTIQELVLRHSWGTRPGSTPPFNSAVLVVGRTKLVEFVTSFAEISSFAADEITRDLTYDPRLVKWTDPQYQPLIPLADDSLVLMPVIIGGSNYERNLLALVDRLPWRQSAADALKQGREDLMVQKIVAAAHPLGLRYRSRLRLGKKNAPIGDVDVLLWNSSGSAVLAVSLKWFYGPDSVHEVAAHSQRHREGIARHRSCVEYLRINLEAVATQFGLDLPVTTATRVSAAFVTNHDEVREQDRDSEIWCSTLAEFISALVDGGGDLDSTSDLLRGLHVTPVGWRVRERWTDYRLDRYVFRIQEHSVTPTDDSSGVPSIA